MAYYDFTSRATSQTVNLDEVDQWLCRKLGIEPNADNYCQPYCVMRETFMMALMALGGASITRRHMAELYEVCMDHNNLELYRDVLEPVFDHFIFTAWR